MGRSKYFNNISETIPSPEEAGRYGAQPLSNWPKNANHTRQHQNYLRPQSFYPTVNSNRHNNQDHRSFERNYDNRPGTVHGSGERRPFYEGINSRRTNNQPSPSTNTSGTNTREKSIDGELPPYRRRRYEYDDRNNGRHSPHIERQQSADRPHRAPRVPYQRSMSENFGSRYKDFTQPQRQSYFEKPGLNRPASPVNFRYPAQNRVLDPVPEDLPRNSPPEVPVSTHHRLEINKMLLQPKIQKYLESNHKRYLVLHMDGTVEHVDSLDSLVKNYPNYVMVKAGDIITNPKNSSIELISTTPREEVLSPNIPKVMQRIATNQNEFATYGYNPRVPYVTEKAYAQPISRPVNIPNEDDSIVQPAIMTTPVSSDTAFFSETTTEYDYDPTHLVETTTEYGSLTSLLESTSEYDVSKPSITTTELTVSIPFIDRAEDDVPYSDSTSEFAPSRILNTVTIREETYTEKPLEILPENPIVDASLVVTMQNYSTMEPTTIIRNDEYLHNDILTNNTFAPKIEPKNDIIPMLRGFYPSAFGKFLRSHFGPTDHINKLNSAHNDQNARRTGEAESATNPFNATDILDAITELTISSTTEKADVSFYDDTNTTIAVLEDSIYTTLGETSSKFYDHQTMYSETPSTSENEGDTSTLNPFIKKNDNQTYRLKHKIKGRRNQTHRKTTESPINLVENDDYTTLKLHTTPKDIVNPFFPFNEPHNETVFVDESTSATETDTHDDLNPFLENQNKDDTNPFFVSTTTQHPKQRRRIRNKKRLKSMAKNYNGTNPFIANLTVDSVIPTERIPDKFADSWNEGVSNPFMDTNPFAEDLHNPFISNVSEAPNPFTEYDNITLSPNETTVNNNNPIVLQETENVYATDIATMPFLPTEKSSFELTTKAISDYTVSEDFDEVPTTTEEVLLLTTTEKPTVWFKMDGDLWEKLSNGSVPYDVVYFFQLQAKPLVEKDAKTTIFPNGTIVQEFIETVWEREGDPAPLLVKSTKTVFPDEGA
ncbi:uncharacterized protein LOC115447515 isoform X2 [Manduca sexta]|uniref:Uncharacterized protein n=1 Tax=Manduca sexta TaxID=7130 RepID=A0A921ZF64_MANSE|nr:uncharacterized protein LOC115447515 isoform X2 [Manduca sexta]KAG6456415.1 hypothetical protein O3G_MSEX009725 [Manduca sexta]